MVIRRGMKRAWEKEREPSSFGQRGMVSCQLLRSFSIDGCYQVFPLDEYFLKLGVYRYEKSSLVKVRYRHVSSAAQ